jgi:hypothetical protein
MRSVLVIAAVVLVGCLGQVDGPAFVAPLPSAGVDAGEVREDAGVAVEPPAADAGEARDAGAQAEVDAGALDAGAPTDAGVTVDAGAPGVRITFPPSGATALTQVTVRGIVAGLTATAARVAGVAASSADGFKSFSAVVPLQPGANTLSVDVQVEGSWRPALATVQLERFATDAAISRGSGPWAGRILGITYEPQSGRVLMTDDVEDGLMGVELASGRRTFLSESESTLVGTGYAIVQPRAVAASATHAWCVDDALIVDIALATGDRTVVATAAGSLSSLELETPSTLLALSPQLEAVLRVQLPSGAQTVLASAAVGSGASLRNVGVMGTSKVQPFAVLGYRYQDTLVRVDLQTGARAVLSQAAAGEPRFSDPEQILIDDAFGRAFVWDSKALTEVNLQTGRRRAVGGRGYPVDSVYGLALTPQGVALLDYVPSYEASPRAPVLVMVDPVDGTRVVLSR